MKNKKYLAWLIAANNLRGVFTSHSFLIEKLCEKFEKIYLINLLNLRYFPDYVIKKKEFNDKIDKKFKIPKNFEIFYPKTKNSRGEVPRPRLASRGPRQTQPRLQL